MRSKSGRPIRMPCNNSDSLDHEVAVEVVRSGQFLDLF